MCSTQSRSCAAGMAARACRACGIVHGLRVLEHDTWVLHHAQSARWSSGGIGCEHPSSSACSWRGLHGIKGVCQHCICLELHPSMLAACRRVGTEARGGRVGIAHSSAQRVDDGAANGVQCSHCQVCCVVRLAGAGGELGMQQQGLGVAHASIEDPSFIGGGVAQALCRCACVHVVLG